MSLSTSPALLELQRLLTIPPASLAVPHRINPLAVAHAALEQLRESGDEQNLFLRTIIEIQPQQQQSLGKDQEELFFHCVTGCRQVVLWHWSRYSNVFRCRLRDYFMFLGHQFARSSRACQVACYTTAVSFWKRGWDGVEDDDARRQSSATTTTTDEPLPEERVLLTSLVLMQAPVLHNAEDLWRYMSGIFHDSALQRQPSMLEPAALFLVCLVGEFAGRSAVSYRLPLEFHKTAHLSFERSALDQTFRLAMTALSYVVSSQLSLDKAAAGVVLVDDAHAALAVVQLVTDVLSWEFGITAFDPGSLGAATMARTIVRPPVQWRQYLVASADLCSALFHAHEVVILAQQQAASTTYFNGVAVLDELAHNLRQLLVLMASLSGPIFAVESIDRRSFASYMADGALKLLQTSTRSLTPDSSDLLDTLQLLSRLIGNFRLSTLVGTPGLVPLLQGLTVVGQRLLTDQLHDCEKAAGCVDAVEHHDWREEAIGQLLDCEVLLCGDPWLLYSGTEQSRLEASRFLSEVLGPLYETFVFCRSRMAALEEHYIVANAEEFDETVEDIHGSDLEEQLSSVATMGRLNLQAAILCLSHLFSTTTPQLEALWQSGAVSGGNDDVTPESAAILEQARHVTMYLGHLLTDNNDGETPNIPEAVLMACEEDHILAASISAAVHAVLKLAEGQAHKIAEDPSNRRLSPMLAKTFLWFLKRWVPAYVYPPDTGSLSAAVIRREWSTSDASRRALSACVNLCLSYQCYWPQERQLQSGAAELLLALARRGPGEVRTTLVDLPTFHQLVRLHCLTAHIRHGASEPELMAMVESKIMAKGSTTAHVSLNMVRGYQRLAYQDRASILTAVLVACSDPPNALATQLTNDALKAVHEGFHSLVGAIAAKQVDPADVDAKEMASLCIEMFIGIAHASEMSNAERIPQLLTSYLPQLSGLMTFYASDLTVCATLLRFFRDYSEHFVVVLDRDQSLALFNAAAEALRSYSAHHCSSRVVAKSVAETEAEEERAYNDVLCTIQLLINLGNKDFIDACNSEDSVNSSQVTDMIFFGLQQLLPLMTQGLLQFPALASKFFDLVGYMMDFYAEKVCLLPYSLFDSLLQCLLFGMSHPEPSIGTCSLQGIASIARQQVAAHSLQLHEDEHPDIFDQCSRRLLTEVVLQNMVIDRVEAAGMALLALIAVDLHRFAQVVRELTSQIRDPYQQGRLQAAFQKLIQPDAIASVGKGGYEERMHRVRFKASFVEFVNDVHSFLILR